MAPERAWAQQSLDKAEFRAAERHAETVELLKEEVRLLGLLAGEPARRPKMGDCAPMDSVEREIAAAQAREGRTGTPAGGGFEILGPTERGNE
jgi:hypothetical protein